MNARSESCVALALPAFRAALELSAELDGATPDLPGAQWLASRGHRVAGPHGGWRTWLLSILGPGADALQRCPAGASVRALATGFREDGCWACAQPVHLVTGLDHLRLAPPSAVELAPAETEALAESIETALAGSGYSLRPCGSDPWTLACPVEIDCDTVEPAQAVGRDIRDFLPAGRDGALVRKLTNELQMLLHEHPVNTGRVALGLAPVNSFWLWGFGCARATEPTPLPALFTDDPWLRGLWRLHGAESAPLAAAASALATEPTLLIAAADADKDSRTQLARWESGLCAPLAVALHRGGVRSARILLGDAEYAVSKGARFAIWRRRRSWSELLA